MDNITDEALEKNDYFADYDDYEDYSQDNNENTMIKVWIYLDAIALLSVAFFLFISILINLANISTVAGHIGLRASGYFHLIASFSVFNIVYFVTKLIFLALTSLSKFELMPTFLSEWIGNNAWITRFFSDLVVALIGLQILLLAVMTIEHRFNLSNHFYFKPRGQTCMRVTLTLIIFAVVIICTIVVFFLRTTESMFDITGKK